MDARNPESETNDIDPALAGQTATELVAKHRKRGRPKGTRNKADANKPAQDPPATVDPAALAANLELIKKTAQSVVHCVDGFVVRRVETRCDRLHARPEIKAEFAGAVQLSKDEMEIVTECAGTIAVRHEWLVKYAPEMMLCAVMTTYSVRVVTVMRKLDAIEHAIKEHIRKGGIKDESTPQE